MDKFRNNSVDIDDETKGFQSTIEIEDVLKEANITLNEATLQTDLLNLFYIYLDCLFLSNNYCGSTALINQDTLHGVCCSM